MMTQEQTAIKVLAAEALQWFETASRSNGETYWRVRDGAPDWILSLDNPEGTLVYVAHNNGKILPDDTRYELIVDVLSAINETPDGDEFAEYMPEPPVYTHDLMVWLNNHPIRRAIVDENIGEVEWENLDQLLTYAYMQEQTAVLDAVLNVLERVADERELDAILEEA